MPEIILHPIGWVSHTAGSSGEGSRASLISEIILAEDIPTETFDKIGDFSHLHILFYFDRLSAEDISWSGHPRNDNRFPVVGIFSHCSPRRPNHLGLTTVELLEHTGRMIKVKGLDAFDGTPVVDIKPVFREDHEAVSIRQPSWADEIGKRDRGRNES